MTKVSSPSMISRSTGCAKASNKKLNLPCERGTFFSSKRKLFHIELSINPVPSWITIGLSLVPGRRNYASTLISDFDDNFNAAGAVKVTGTIERELTLVQYHDKDVAEGIGRNLRIWKWWTIPEQANAGKACAVDR